MRHREISKRDCFPWRVCPVGLDRALLEFVIRDERNRCSCSLRPFYFDTQRIRRSISRSLRKILRKNLVRDVSAFKIVSLKQRNPTGSYVLRKLLEKYVPNSRKKVKQKKKKINRRSRKWDKLSKKKSVLCRTTARTYGHAPPFLILILTSLSPRSFLQLLKESTLPMRQAIYRLWSQSSHSYSCLLW